MSQDNKHKFDPANLKKLEDPRRNEYFPHAQIIEALVLEAGDRVIDVGCGAGYWLLPLLNAAPEGVRFIGADIQPALLEYLSEKLKEHPRKEWVTLESSEENALPAGDGSQSAAIMGLVYHELSDRRRFLKEVKRALSPGGRLVIIDWDVLPAGVERTMGPPIDERVSFERTREELMAEGFVNLRRVEGFKEAYALIANKPPV